MRPMARVGFVVAMLGAVLFAPLPAEASPPAQVSEIVEILGAPLRIQVSANGRLQVYHRDFTHGATFGDGASGAFLAVGSTIYGPNVPLGPFSIQPDILANEGPLGNGTAADPFRLVNTQRLTGAGADLGVVQTVSYVNGENRFRLEWAITNNGGDQTCFRFYHAADLYFADSDYGFGFYDSGSGAVGGFNENRDWYMVFNPTVPADHYQEAHYTTIWTIIGAGENLSDTTSSVYEDNGAGLQWDVCLGPGQATTLGDLWSFGATQREAISAEASGGFRATGPLASELTTHIPTPLDVSLDPGVIGANLLLAALAMIAFVSASGVLTSILGENREEVERFPLVRWIASAQKALRTALGARLSRLSTAGLVKLVGIVLFYGLVFSLLDRTWSPFRVAGLWLLFSMTIAYGVVGIAADIVQWIAARRWGLPADLTLRPTTIILAFLSTAASRIFGLVPGLMFGVPEAFDIDPKALDRVRERRLLLVAAGTLAAIGACAWLPTLVTALVQRVRLPELLMALVGGVESLLLVIFAVTVENSFVEMLPLPGNVGHALRQWNRWLWFAGLGAVVFIFLHLLMNPTGDLAEALRNANIRFFVLTVVVFSLAVGALWLYLKVVKARGSHAAPAPVSADASRGIAILDEPAVGHPGVASRAPGAGGKPAEVLGQPAGPGRRLQLKGIRISPLAFGILGTAVALVVALIGVVCLVVALAATFG